jgi:signal transduction histidine kinase
MRLAPRYSFQQLVLLYNCQFSQFFRSKNAKTSPIKGSGLGLHLAQYFTELHSGELFVESTYGKGSTFTVKLPSA